MKVYTPEEINEAYLKAPVRAGDTVKITRTLFDTEKEIAITGTVVYIFWNGFARIAGDDGTVRIERWENITKVADGRIRRPNAAEPLACEDTTK